MLRWMQNWATKRQKDQAKRKAMEEYEEAARLKYQEEHDKIEALSKEEAIRRFYLAVELGQIELRREPARDMEIIDLLPTAVRDLFANVSDVNILETDGRIRRKNFSVEHFPGYIYVGEPFETLALVIKYHEDGVYLESYGGFPKQIEVRVPNLPSLFHYFLCELIPQGEDLLDD